jgi:hypothetical protein
VGYSGSPSGSLSSPARSDGGESIVSQAGSDASSSASIKSEAAQLLGLSLQQDTTEEEPNASFVRVVYRVLVENWEAWSKILGMLKSPCASTHDEETILKLLEEMKGGEKVVGTYVCQAIDQAVLFKKHELVKRLKHLKLTLSGEETKSN